MIKCSCGYENNDKERICGMCKAPLHKKSSQEQTEERKEQWSFTNVGAVKQTAGVNPLKVSGESEGGSWVMKLLILFALAVFIGLGVAAYFMFFRK